MAFLRLTDLDVAGKRLLIREDLNVPINNGIINSDARLRASIPTIKLALKKGAAVIVCSHLGRPKAGEFDANLSLAPIADYLSQALGQSVALIDNFKAMPKVAPGQVVLLENVRFNVGEKTNDDVLAKAYAALCDVFVMDAFGTAHRAEASTEGVIRYSPIACAGPLLADELDALDHALHNPKKPLLAIVAGSKVSTKLEVLMSLSDQCDHLITGGGIANTFLAAAGFSVGKSLYEPDLVDTAKAIADKVFVPLPEDVVVVDARNMGDDFMAFISASTPVIKSVKDVGEHDMIVDIGPKTAATFTQFILEARTILWNGPVGVFEVDAFGAGTEILARAIAHNAGFSIAGGGDTLAAIEKYGVGNNISYISTGGGAFLEFVEGKTLPAVAALEAHAASVHV